MSAYNWSRPVDVLFEMNNRIDMVTRLALFPCRLDITGALFAVRYQTEIYDAYKRVEVAGKVLSISIINAQDSFKD
jgi:hypothetical protein